MRDNCEKKKKIYGLESVIYYSKTSFLFERSLCSSGLVKVMTKDDETDDNVGYITLLILQYSQFMTNG